MNSTVNAVDFTRAGRAKDAPPPLWFARAIGAGMAGLLQLRFPYGSPAGDRDGTAATTMVWINTLWPGRKWDPPRDEPRIAEAFLRLRHGTRWPVPRDFLDALPPIPKPKPAQRLSSAAADAAARHYLDEIAARLGSGLVKSAEATAARARQIEAEKRRLEAELAAQRLAREVAAREVDS